MNKIFRGVLYVSSILLLGLVFFAAYQNVKENKSNAVSDETVKVSTENEGETALEKKMFRESVLNRRIIIPATGFYEWNHEKEKVTFIAENAVRGKNAILYLAGVYGHFEGEDTVIVFL